MVIRHIIAKLVKTMMWRFFTAGFTLLYIVMVFVSKYTWSCRWVFKFQFYINDDSLCCLIRDLIENILSFSG